MNRFTGKSRPLRRMTLAGAGLLAVSAMIAGVAAASPAAADTKIKATYKVTGSTVIKSENATVKLGPGKLASTVDFTTGKLTAKLTLPHATASFKQDGLIPVTAVTAFIQDGLTTGTINLGTGAVKSTSRVTLQIVSLSVAGVPVPVGSSCESASPASITLKSLKGFNPLKGGKLAGTYTIPQFANCGLATPLLNATVPGPGNTISLKLGKAKIG
jgi:hypothetical protein